MGRIHKLLQKSRYIAKAEIIKILNKFEGDKTQIEKSKPAKLNKLIIRDKCYKKQ